MHEITTPLIESFARAHPIAQLALLIVMLGVLVVSVIAGVRARWHNQATREQRDKYMHENLGLKRELDQAKDRHEKLVRKFKAREAENQNRFDAAIGQLQAKLDDSRKTAAVYQQKLRQALPAFDKVRAHNDSLLQENHESEKTRQRLQAELSALLQRFDDLQKIDTTVWTGKSSQVGPPPTFVPRERRRARFVTFLNLKGGVGKTTIVANLAAALATGVLGDKKRVLAVDLDYQGTLSNRCVERRILDDRRGQRRTADRLVDTSPAADPAEVVRDLLVPIGATGEMGSIIIADDLLDNFDFRKQALFAIECVEVRFEHRRLLHQPAVTDQFDFVFFDCPPRLTTSSINALAASDWIVVPTGLDPNDVEAVPRSLRWFERLRTQANIDFHAQLAGIILNGTFKSTVDEPASYELPNLTQLRRLIERFVPSPDAMILRNTIKNDSAISRDDAGEPFGATAKGRERYGAVAAELYQRIKN
jgi:cellulose biosynthesis protein BcsQ